MGQKESKLQATGGQSSRSGDSLPGPFGLGSSGRHSRHQSNNRNRPSHVDIGGILQAGIPGGSSQQEPSYDRRETRQEREARKRERERLLREKERERSLKEEHIDGGYLVTLGTYIGAEDFSKPAVRQFQIERRLAPFWRGLNDINSQWTEHQIIAAARGLPIPKANEPPPDDLIPKPCPPQSPTTTSGSNLQNLTVPIGPRSLSQASNHSGSNLGSTLTSPSTATTHMSSVKAKGKALATALKPSSRNTSQVDISTPREVNLPPHPFVNGQPLEVFLYKDAQECPICFLSYPPYLNRTRCCDQPICSECFVQIKRPDPHLPEHHGDDPDQPPDQPEETQLVSEPAQCPYCQASEFGVTYEPPLFRRGLAYAVSSPTGAATNTTVTTASTSAAPPATARRRAQSLAANAPRVITTDKVRPDWFAKLEGQRSQQARRAAAATALHTATYLMGASESRSIFGRSSRINRRQASTSAVGGNANESNTSAASTDLATNQPSAVPEPISRGPAGGRGGFLDARRVEDLEELMMAEAVRLSLADEEERKRKAAKEAKKEAKKKGEGEGKEGRKSGQVGDATSSGSSLNPERKDKNNATSNLRIEPRVANVINAEASSRNSPSSQDKGKAVDRSPSNEDSNDDSFAATSSAIVGSLPIPTASNHQVRGPSHLRQMSSASSVSSSIAGSAAGSYTRKDMADSRPTALSAGEEGQAEAGSTPNEPMFNFRSLAEMVGVQIEGEDAGKATKQADTDGDDAVQNSAPTGESSAKAEGATSSSESAIRPSGDSKSDGEKSSSKVTTIPTATPAAPDSEASTDSKTLDEQGTVVSRHVEITQ